MPPGLRFVHLPRLLSVSLLAVLIFAAACAPGPVLVSTPALDATPTPLGLVEPDLLLLPDAFRYEVTLRPADLPDEAVTVITGQYRAGALAQTARRGNDSSEELVVAPDPEVGTAHSYTHAPGETSWTRWPGVGFDTLYGLSSPFSALRLYPLVDEKTTGEPEAAPGAPEVTMKVQTVVFAATVERLLRAGASAVAANAEQRAALESQLAPLLVPQTITYWVSEGGHVYQAAATLLMAGGDGQPVPWLEVIWRYWGYGDPTVTVSAPAEFADIADLVPAVHAEVDEAPLAPDTSLRVRVFANPGVPATDVAVMVYPAKKMQALATQYRADAQFALGDGVYDVQVQVKKAIVWLHDVVVTAGTVASHDVVFDFGALVLVVMQDGSMPQVDTVIYPAGQRQTWVDWRTENPTTVQLPAGVYDVEVALPDFSATKRVEGVEISGGQTVTVTVDLGQ